MEWGRVSYTNGETITSGVPCTEDTPREGRDPTKVVPREYQGCSEGNLNVVEDRRRNMKRQ